MAWTGQNFSVTCRPHHNPLRSQARPRPMPGRFHPARCQHQEPQEPETPPHTHQARRTAPTHSTPTDRLDFRAASPPCWTRTRRATFCTRRPAPSPRTREPRLLQPTARHQAGHQVDRTMRAQAWRERPHCLRIRRHRAAGQVDRSTGAETYGRLDRCSSHHSVKMPSSKGPSTICPRHTPSPPGRRTMILAFRSPSDPVMSIPASSTRRCASRSCSVPTRLSLRQPSGSRLLKSTNTLIVRPHELPQPSPLPGRPSEDAPQRPATELAGQEGRSASCPRENRDQARDFHEFQASW